MKAEYKRRIAKAAEQTVDVPEDPVFTILFVESENGKPTGKYTEVLPDGTRTVKWDYFERGGLEHGVEFIGYKMPEREIHFDDALIDV